MMDPKHEMNGDEATVRLKRNASTRNIPVVINTSWSMSCNVGDRVDRALNAGAEEILYKPYHLSTLRGVLHIFNDLGLAVKNSLRRTGSYE